MSNPFLKQIKEQKMSSFVSKRTQFVFQSDASQIECKELGFENYQEYAEQMSNEDLIAYIMAEAERFRVSRVKDVSHL